MLEKPSPPPVLKPDVAKPWLVAAAAAAQALQDDSWRATHSSASDWVTDAAKRADYTLNAFRRQVKLAEYLRYKVSADDWKTLLESGAPFAAMEVMQRLEAVDGVQADKLFAKALSGELLYRDLLEVFHAAQDAAGGGSGKATYANRAQQFRQRAVESIHTHLELFIGPVVGEPAAIRAGLRGFALAKPDVVAVTSSSSGIKPGQLLVDAFDIRLFGQDDSKHVLLRTLERCALMERLFRRTWLVYPANDPPVAGHAVHLDALVAQLDALALGSVGIATVAEQTSASHGQRTLPSILRRPKPNRRPSNAALVEQWLKHEGR